MEITLLAIRLGLCGVFGVAGVAKLADMKGSRKALDDFGVPAAVSPTLAVLLPLAEITVAASLLIADYSWFGAIGAAVMLAIFVAGMTYQMFKGNAPDCHCFGQVHSEPVGAKSLIRNLFFFVPALFLIYSGRGFQGPSLLTLTRDDVQMLAVIACTGMLAFVVAYLKKITGNQAEIIRRIELVELIAQDGGSVERDEAGNPQDGLPIGAILPEFDLPAIDGTSVTDADLAVTGRPSILFFVKPTCIPCNAMTPQFETWERELADRANVILISSGNAAENKEKFGFNDSTRVLLQADREFADLVQAKWTPSAIYVNAAGRIASHVAAGDVAIEALINSVKNTKVNEPSVYFTNGGRNSDLPDIRIGEGLPRFSIGAIDGRTIASTDLKGKSTLITFWSPTCPHCQDMIEEIRDWEKAKGMDQPDLIVFSDGDVREHMKIGLVSPIVIDHGFKTAIKLGMHGTPSAILIDDEGRFASELAIGARNIWSLVGRH